jgi:hypothetical protein
VLATLRGVGLQRFERRLERLVEGTFSKAFRSGLQPVEIARKLVREIDAGRTLGVHGSVVPNDFTVNISPRDYDRFESFDDVLARELADQARAHARDEGYRFVGPVEVRLVEDPELGTGTCGIEARILEGALGLVGSLVLPDGRRIPLADETVTIGRVPDSTVPIEDARVSRHHAEVKPAPEGFLLRDVGSMNGTLVNGVNVKEHLLQDGDEIGVGSTTIRFEAS